MSKTELEKILEHEQSLPFCEVSYKGQNKQMHTSSCCRANLRRVLMG